MAQICAQLIGAPQAREEARRPENGKFFGRVEEGRQAHDALVLQCRVMLRDAELVQKDHFGLAHPPPHLLPESQTNAECCSWNTNRPHGSGNNPIPHANAHQNAGKKCCRRCPPEIENEKHGQKFQPARRLPIVTQEVAVMRNLRTQPVIAFADLVHAAVTWNFPVTTPFAQANLYRDSSEHLGLKLCFEAHHVILRTKRHGFAWAVQWYRCIYGFIIHCIWI
mmetsp:Transcript_28642/g.66371  ORF Transcript_28642/g.66371 Transcript_28642/m.66371 type:complete len:223 (-) Transcript_28642:60-728(-)